MAAQQPRGLRLSYARLHSARATVGITPRPGALPVFGSERLTGALLDRLTHHVHILEMNGESYRLKHSRNKQK